MEATSEGLFNKGKTAQRIEDAYTAKTVGGMREAGATASANAENLSTGLSRYGGEAFDTGASKQAYAQTFSDLDKAISNIYLNAQSNKEQALRSSEQFLQTMASQGIIDPKYGNFLRSTFDQQLEINQIEFERKLQLAREQEDAMGIAGIGRIVGMGIGIATGNPAIIAASAGITPQTETINSSTMAGGK